MSESCKGCKHGQLLRVNRVTLTYPDIPVVLIKTQCCLKRVTFSGRGPGCNNYKRDMK